ncbi:DNA replication protein [Thermoanaerobacter thermohydrosulfuricus WC1]|uniref:AAA ATPase n=3 Tax=Thermoanaerobacteraceae TaxID=186814 RepID=D3T360_THEIA|nr:AAA ATPase [Thermoanaerobacter italicus Ab9]EMT37941.1 DNA replication protein [Thermoanaerobacter thermohydrosulfuricus WC1]
MKESELASDVCPNCGSKTSMEIEILGQKYTVPVMCKCRKEEYERQEREFQNQQRKIRLERLRQYSLMDKRFEQCTFENFQINENNQKLYKMAVNYCKRWPEMKAKNIGFLFWGPPGTGKSFLAFCIANKLIENLVPVIAISTIGLLNRIKQTYKNYSEEEEVEIINILRNASLLVLDDLGAENNNDWAREKLYEIIDSRYRDGKPMIVTTNLTLTQLKEKLTGWDGVARTYDRLIEMCYPVEIKGTSKRVKAANEKTKIIEELVNE